MHIHLMLRILNEQYTKSQRKIGFNLLTLLNLASAIPILVHNQSSKHINVSMLLHTIAN